MSLRRDYYDAVVVGSGPNGLSAAITLAERFASVLLLEAKPTIGGGCRSAELTLPGFIHDVCSAVQPLGFYSPVLRAFGLEHHGLAWIQPEIPLAHPFDDGTALCLHRSLDATAAALGSDAAPYRALMAPFVEHHAQLLADILKPLPLPGHPLLMARFGLQAVRSARSLALESFRDARTRALFAGLAAHGMVPLDRLATAGFGLVLATLAHAVGWPIVKGGSQKLADALAQCFLDRGGEIRTGLSVSACRDLPRADYYFFDLTPRQLLHINDLNLSKIYRRRIARFRYGPGVCKVDWALHAPIPWEAEACRRAGTVHIGRSLEEIEASIRAVHAGRYTDSPFIVLVQPSLFDPSRAPEGHHTAWAYCHAPHSTPQDMADLIESRIERYAPGFRSLILERSSMPPLAMERYNPNYIGGDINGGLQDIFQLYTRPVLSFPPYRTSNPRVLLCSSSTPPGGGVHGLCGYYAAQSI